MVTVKKGSGSYSLYMDVVLDRKLKACGISNMSLIGLITLYQEQMGDVADTLSIFYTIYEYNTHGSSILL